MASGRGPVTESPSQPRASRHLKRRFAGLMIRRDSSHSFGMTIRLDVVARLSFRPKGEISFGKWDPPPKKAPARPSFRGAKRRGNLIVEARKPEIPTSRPFADSGPLLRRNSHRLEACATRSLGISRVAPASCRCAPASARCLIPITRDAGVMLSTAILTASLSTPSGSSPFPVPPAATPLQGIAQPAQRLPAAIALRPFRWWIVVHPVR